MTHCTSVIVAWRSAWSAGSATLTTVASMNVKLDPRMVATRVQRLRASRSDDPPHVGDRRLEVSLERGQRDVDDRGIDERQARPQDGGHEGPAVACQQIG